MRETTTTRRTRSSLARRVAALACTLTALGVLAAPALTAAPSVAGELGFPYVNHFDSAGGGTLDGDAAVVDGRLRLTDARTGQAGAWSTDDTFRSDVGLEIEFRYAMYNDVGDIGADGLLLFLADGAAPQGVGAYGAALGYACRSSLTQGGDVPCDLPGLPGAFAAVALDHYGNFSRSINQSGPGRAPASVVVRGSGDGTTGYRYVDGAPSPGGVLTDGPAMRKVRVTLLPGGHGELSMTVRLETGGVLRTVLDRVPLHGDGQAALPATLRLGFSAATGSHVDVHEVDALGVWQPADLAVEHDLAPTATAGERVEYTVTARNVGANDSDPSALDVDVPDALRDVSWQCTADAGSGCGTAAGTGDVATQLDLPRTGSATVTISGDLPPDATGPLESAATIAPAPPLADVHEPDNVSRATATVEAPPAPVAQLDTDKSVQPATDIAPGDEVEYLVTAHNRRPAVAEQVGAVDELPAAMRFVGSDDGCTAAGQLVTCDSGRSLAAGESIAFRIRAELDPGYVGDGSDVVNIATASSPTDPDGGAPSPQVPISVVIPGDGGPGDGGPGDGGPDDGGPGDGGRGDGDAGSADRGDGGPGDGQPSHGGPGDGGSARSGGTRSLAYTGAEGLGLAAAISAGATAVGSACWWAVRCRRARTADGPVPD